MKGGGGFLKYGDQKGAKYNSQPGVNNQSPHHESIELMSLTFSKSVGNLVICQHYLSLLKGGAYGLPTSWNYSRKFILKTGNAFKEAVNITRCNSNIYLLSCTSRASRSNPSFPLTKISAVTEIP